MESKNSWTIFVCPTSRLRSIHHFSVIFYISVPYFCTFDAHLEIFFGVHLKFAWLKTSKNSTFRIFSRKNLTTGRYFRTFWVLWRHFRWFVGSFRAKNRSKMTFSSYFDQANSPHDVWYPKKRFPFCVFCGPAEVKQTPNHSIKILHMANFRVVRS